MEKRTKEKRWNGKKGMCCAGLALTAFVFWTAAVRMVDVEKIGPRGSSVGFASLNRAVHELTGVHMELYTLTDWLGLVPIGLAAGFALLGLAQLLRRRSLLKVDRDILLLGGFYVLVLASYLFFEKAVVNYRPVLIDGYLEASYPSSTTVLVLCIVPTAMMQLSKRITNPWIRRGSLALLSVFAAGMVTGRLLSGVHWLTDIVGGILLSAGLVLLYNSFAAKHLL